MKGPRRFKGEDGRLRDRQWANREARRDDSELGGKTKLKAGAMRGGDVDVDGLFDRMALGRCGS